jgi:TonB family protein
MDRRAQELRPALAALGASLVAHVGLTTLGWAVAAKPARPLEARWVELTLGALPEEREIEVGRELLDTPVVQSVVRVTLGLAASWRWLAWLGGSTVARPDTAEPGRGGEAAASDRAVNLAAADDGIRLSEAVQTRIDRNQVRRFGADERRSSPENASLGPAPMSLLLLGMGGSDHRSTWSGALSDWPQLLGVRQPSASAPVGARGPGLPSAVAWTGSSGAGAYGELSAGAAGEPWSGAAPGSEPGTPVGDPSIQVTYVPLDEWRPAQPLGREAVERDRTASGEAQGHEGAESAPGDERGPARDTTKAEQEEASLRQGALLASTAGGEPGRGVGGSAGPGAPGYGGSSGPGSVSRPMGNGPGAYRGVDPADLRRRSYIRGVLARVHPLWKDAFPRRAALEGKQGTTIIGFVIQPDGSVGAASVVRPSGVPPFDENCRRAVLRAAPFPPLPAELRPALSFQLPFVFENPVVRPPELPARD